MESRIVACLCTSLNEVEPTSVIDVMKRAKIITWHMGQKSDTTVIKVLMILYHGHPNSMVPEQWLALGNLLDQGIAFQILKEIRVRQELCC